MIRKLCVLAVSIVSGLVFLSASACSGPNPAGSQTAGQLAAAGKSVYQENCAKCHGENGQQVNGSALMGGDNVLANYETGQMLYNYIVKNMPDDNPGSLSPAQYLQVETYLLLQDGYIQPGTSVTQNNLEQIPIEKH